MTKFKILSAFIECAQGIVPKVETLQRYITVISRMGYNRLYLGMSDAYKIKEEPYFNYKRGGYTVDDLKQIDAFANEHGIEVVGQIHTLSHLHFLKKYPEYTDIFDTDSVLMVGEERVYTLAENMIKTISEGLSSRRIHLGLDEAFGIGTGKYLEKHGPADKKELILEHLQKVVKIAEKYGLSCEIWGDMLSETNNTHVTAEDVKKTLPDNVMVYLWDYYPGEVSHFDSLIKNMKKHTNNLGFAGCAWKHIGFGPNMRYSLAGILPQMDACVENGIEHYMITMWADNTAPTSIFSCLPVLYCAAEYANGSWDGKGFPDKEKFRKITGIEFDDIFSLEYINHPNKTPCSSISTSAFWVFFNDLLLGNFDQFLEDGVEKAYAALEKEYMALSSGEFGYIFEKSAKLMGVLKIKAPLTKRIRTAYENKNKDELRLIIPDIKKLITATEEFIDSFEKYFLHDNRGFGLEVHHIDFGSTVYRAKYAIKRLENYIENDQPIEELEGGILPLEYNPPITVDNSCMLDYKLLISYCIP